MMLVKDVMTRQAEWIAPETTLLDAAKKMHDKKIGSLLVGEKDRIIGIVTDRDIACRGVAQNLIPADTPVRKVMTEKIIWCFDDQAIEDAAHVMEDKKVRRLAVMNREKRMVGFLSVDDLAHRAHGLSGEILDEVTAH
jgi:CBS domain-containing protein